MLSGLMKRAIVRLGLAVMIPGIVFAQVSSTTPIPFDPNLHIHLQNRIAYGPTPVDTRSIASNAAKWVGDNLNASYADPARLTNLLALMDLPTYNDQLHPNNDIETVAQLQVAYALYSRNQLQQQMTNFWDNHFNTEYNKLRMYFRKHFFDDNNTLGAQLAAYFEWLENRDFRTQALGSFQDLLETSAYGPAMMVYLDTISSQNVNPNENYARELLELHTVGVVGHSQLDVTEASALFTGLTIKPVPPADYGNPLASEVTSAQALAVGDVNFSGQVDIDDQVQVLADWGTNNPDSDINGDGTVDQADLDILLANWGLITYVYGPYYDETDYTSGTKTIFTGSDQIILGDNSTGTRAQKFQEIQDFLAHLAGLERTASYVCAKLIVKFVSPQDPDDLASWPTALITLHGRAVGAWRTNNGDIGKVLESIFDQKEFINNHRYKKTETPFESAVSAIRALETGNTANMGSVDLVSELEYIRESIEEKSFHPFFEIRPPTGFDEENPPGSGNLLARMKLNERTYTGTDSLGFDWSAIITPPATSPDVTYLVQKMLPLMYGPRGIPPPDCDH